MMHLALGLFLGWLALAPQQAPPADTTAAPNTTAVADTLAGALVGPPERPTATPVQEVTDDLASLLSGIGREVDRLQQRVGRPFEQLRTTFTLSRLGLALLALLITYALVWLLVRTLEGLARWRPRYAGRLRSAIPVVKFGVWFVALWFIVSALFAGSTILLFLLVVSVALAVGYGVFQLLRDVVGGLVLLFEQPFEIGSRIAVGAHTGEVKRIGLRTFHLATADGALVVVPNTEVLRRAVVSTPPDTPEAPVTVTLAVPEALDGTRARALAREAAYASPFVYPARPVRVDLEETDATGHPRRLVVRAHVFDGRHAAALADDVRRLAGAAFHTAAGEG